LEGLSILGDIPEDRVRIAEQLDNPMEIYSTRSEFNRWQEAMSEFNYTAVALRQGHYKYIAYSDGRRELFNLTLDPSEVRNVAEVEREQATYFEELLAETGRDAILGAYTDVESEKILSHLEQLGYI
jgi:hypothetical protein